MPSRVQVIADRYAADLSSGKRGGMSVVYRANDVQTATTVALKLFRSVAESEERQLLAEAFRREVSALRALEHPNIVKLLDAEAAPAEGQPYLVLEWMNGTLPDYMKDWPEADGWEPFYERVARPLLEALNFAHERYCIHRDVKPSNVLVAGDGQVKLADFGISKLKEWLTPGVTLAEFQSRPYAPPEPDEGDYSYTRDVFGFAVTMLECFTGTRPSRFEDLEQLLEEFDAPPAVAEVMERAISADPAVRPRNAGALLRELERIHRRRSDTWKDQVHFQVLPPHRDRITAATGESTFERAKAIILDDLRDQPSILAYEARNANGEIERRSGEVRILGQAYQYHAAINNQTHDHLVIFSCSVPPPDLMERWRQRAWDAPFKLAYGAPHPGETSRRVVEEIQVGLAEHEVELQAAAAARERQSLFIQWDALLRAKLEAEKTRIQPLAYSSATPAGRRVTFALREPLSDDDDVVGQSRLLDLPSRKRALGVVEYASGREVLVHFEDGDLSELPNSGVLQFDIRGAEQALQREKAALDMVRYDRAVRPDLGQLLIDPGSATSPTTHSTVDFVQSDLDDAKKEAVVAAVHSPDLMIVHGPPGTGKTTFIAELVFQQFRQKRDSRILIASQTHAALDNAIERIQKHEHELKLVRIGDPFNGRVASAVEPLLIDRQMRSWTQEVQAAGEQYLCDWAIQRGINPHDVRVGLYLQRVVSEQQRLERIAVELEQLRIEDKQADGDAPAPSELLSIAAELGDVGETTAERIETLQDEQATARERFKRWQVRLAELGDTEKELAGLTFEQQQEWMESLLAGTSHVGEFKDLLIMHEEWSARLQKHEDFYDAFLGGCDVVAATCVGVAGRYGAGTLSYDLCIIDEASRAWATEMLVPMVRANRWVIVGDDKQLPPFEGQLAQRRDLLKEFNLSRSQLEETLFGRLTTQLPDPCVKRLTVQHRMVRAIGDLISACFYNDQLRSARDDNPTLLAPILYKPVCWYSTSNTPNSGEIADDERSFLNPAEATVIAKMLKYMNTLAESASVPLEVAVIAGYAGQRRQLRRTIDAHLDTWTALRIDVNTVHEFQGREADVCIYSVTRSNEDNNIGFLRSEALLNVALSRGRDWLVIVGDHAFCRTAKDPNPLREVLEYIELHPDSCHLKELGR